MSKRYENDFKVMIVELLKSGRTIRELCDEYTIDKSTIRRWRNEYKTKSGDFSKKRVVSVQELELKTLRKELREVQLERDILKKAVTIFSKSDK